MVSPVVASAPGKLFLIGEYAVLDGAPALLAAVDRRVQVTLEPAAGRHWSLTAANLGLHGLDLGPQGRGDAAIDTETRDKLAVFDAVRAYVEQRLGEALPPCDIVIDSADFSGTAGKLGLGSSAAVAAALTAALMAYAGQAIDRDPLAEFAIAAHRNAQHGSGSGGDVACAVYGGLIRYTRDAPVVARDWPGDLGAFAVVTGAGSKTPELVARVKAYAQHDAAGYARDIARLGRIAEQATTGHVNTDDFLGLSRDYFDALRTLDAHAGAGIVTSQHEMLHDVAAEHGGVFKSSGAGGGDVGLAFARAGQPLARLKRALSEAGAEIVDLDFAAPGVRIESYAT